MCLGRGRVSSPEGDSGIFFALPPLWRAGLVSDVAARLGLHTAVDNRRGLAVCAAAGLEASGFPGIGATGPLRRGEPRLYWRGWPPLEETQVVGGASREPTIAASRWR